MHNQYKFILTLLLISVSVFFISCDSAEEDVEKEEQEESPQKELNEATFTISDLFTTFNGEEITSDTVAISGFIISNDETGNVTNAIYLRDETGAVSIQIEGENLFQTYPIGQLVIFNCSGLTPDISARQLTAATPLQLSDHEDFSRVSTVKDEQDPVSLEYTELTDNYLSDLVEISGFEFNESKVNSPLQSGDSEFLLLTDEDQNEILVRVAENADFANETIPVGRGPVTGILDREENSYVIIPRSFDDFEFTKNRRAPYEKMSFDLGDNTLPYQIMFPFEYDENGSYPLVVFLHGAGERGSDNERQMAYGPDTFGSYQARQDYPAIVLFPQCPSDVMWSRRNKYTNENDELIFEFPVEENPNYAMEMVIELVNELKANESVDPNRIYITGLSMGGIGSFEFAYYAPDIPAAVASMAGGHDPSLLTQYGENIAFSIYHGSNDGVVPPRYSREMFAEMQSLGYDARFFEAEGRGHEWNYVLEDPDYIDWLFQQVRTD